MPALLVIAAAGPVAFALAAVGILDDGALDWMSTWLSSAVFVGGAAVCFTRVALVDAHRSVWACMGVACCCWALANLYYALFVHPDPLPLPSPADAGYFSFPIILSAGLLRFGRSRVPGLAADVWLDGLVVGLGAAAAAAAAVFGVVTVHDDRLPGIITSLVYPLEDVGVLGVFIAVGSVTGWRLGRAGLLLAPAIVAILAGDLIVSTRVLSGSNAGSAMSNVGWTAGIGLIAVAAWQHDGPPATPAARSAQLQLMLPVASAVVAVVVLALSGPLRLSAAASVLAVATLLVACTRLLRAFHEVRALAENRELALTDELTGLPNRRRLLADLARVCERRSARLLTIFDLDGFKQFNDTFGHPEGDLLLARLAGRLADTVREHGTAYRLGGDEFCVLVDTTDAGRRTVDDAAYALSDRGAGFSVTASFGVVDLPEEAVTTSAALKIADARMYAQKDRRPAAARQQARDVLLSALGEQQPDLHAHLQDVTRLAGDVARRLGMSAEAADDVLRAAELHDVGKLAIPREILEKPGPLDDDEWVIMRTHTIVGERMLRSAAALAAVAPLVRSSHERWDGKGYPDGLSGEAIPLGSRIVAVCDTFDAMVADRPYRRGVPQDEAAAELRRCAGTQFDPDVVEAFLAVLSEGYAAVELEQPAGDTR